MVKGFEEERGGKEKKTNNQSESTQKFLLKAVPEAQGSSRGDILKTRNVISAKAKTFSMSQSKTVILQSFEPEMIKIMVPVESRSY